jgi:hypothetical protein
MQKFIEVIDLSLLSKILKVVSDNVTIKLFSTNNSPFMPMAAE